MTIQKYIIGSKHKKTGEFSIATNPKIWDVATAYDYGKVVEEAKRLARMYADKVFIIMKLDIAFATDDVIQVSI